MRIGRKERPPDVLMSSRLLKVVLFFMTVVGALGISALVFGAILGTIKISGGAFPTLSALDANTSSVGMSHSVLSAYALVYALVGASVLGAAMTVYRRSASSFVAPNGHKWLYYGAWGLLISLTVQVWLSIPLLLELPDIDVPVADAYRRGMLLDYFLTCAFFLFVIAAAEEVVFRGVLLQVAMTFTRNVWVLCIVNGILFSIAHAFFEFVPFVASFIWGAAWTWFTLRTGSISFAVFTHWIGNLNMMLFGSRFTGPSGDHIVAMDLVSEVIVAAATVVLFRLLMRRDRVAELLRTASGA